MTSTASRDGRWLGFEAGDAALAVVDATAVLLVEPGVAAVEDGRIVNGTAALGALRRLPLAASLRHWSELAAAPASSRLPPARELVAAHLASLVAAAGPAEGVVVATPGYWDAARVTAFATLAAAAGWPVVASVPAAVAVARAAHPGFTVLYLEAALQGAVLTRLASDGGAEIGEQAILPGPGIEALQRVAAEFIARRFVEASRYDPLHSPGSEQALHDALPAWLARFAREPTVALELATAAGRYAATVAAAELRGRVALACEPLLQRLRALAASRGRLALLVHHRYADFPGVVETLLRVPGARVVVLDPGAAARGALARLPALRAAAPLATRLPFDEPPVMAEAALPTGALAGARPTHLLYGHRAFRLGAEPFLIGLELAPGETGIALDAGARGVSRRHCTLRSEDGSCLVFDHSRFGTALNGHRIQGSAVLEAGDVLTVGTPPAEFRLIAEEAVHGPA